MTRCKFLIAAVLLAGACGRSPTAPSDPVPLATPITSTLSGTWIGRMTFSYRGRDNQYLDTVVALEQHGADVRGHWTVTAPDGNDVGGLMSGTVEAAQFSGIAQWDSPAEGVSVRCRGRATFTGTTDVPLHWRAERFQFENCTDAPTNIGWILNRP